MKNGQNAPEDPNFSKRIHILYADKLHTEITNEKNTTQKRVDKIKEVQQKDMQRIYELREDNNNLEAKIKRYRGLLQEQIDASAKRGTDDGDKSTIGGKARADFAGL